MLRKLVVAGALMTVVSLPSGKLVAQDAKAIIAGASKAMGADGLNSITYSGSAANGNFGQSKTIAGPLAVTTITNYTRAIDLTQPASRATGATMPPAIPGAPPPTPGMFNQNITPTNTAWTQQLEIWVTPWGFLKGAAANNCHRPLPEASRGRPTTSCRGPRLRRHPRDRPTGSTATSTIRTWSNASRPGSNTLCSGICSSTRPTATTRISAASRSRRRSSEASRT